MSFKENDKFCFKNIHQILLCLVSYPLLYKRHSLHSWSSIKSALEIKNSRSDNFFVDCTLPRTMLLDHCLKILHNTVKHMNLPTVV